MRISAQSPIAVQIGAFRSVAQNNSPSFVSQILRFSGCLASFRPFFLTSIALVCFSLVSVFSVKAALFRLPLANDSPVHYYFDRNRGSGTPTAWNGSTDTYSNHNGTDFTGIAGDLRGATVFAAVGGILIESVDLYGDGSLQETTHPNGNYVRIY